MGNTWAVCDGGRNRDPRDTLGLIRISLRVRRKTGAVRGPGAPVSPGATMEAPGEGLGLESASPGLVSRTILY